MMRMAQIRNACITACITQCWAMQQKERTCSHEVWVIQTSCMTFTHISRLLLHDPSSQ